MVVLCYRTNGRLAPVWHSHRVHHMADGSMLERRIYGSRWACNMARLSWMMLRSGLALVQVEGLGIFSGDAVHLRHRQSTLSSDESEREERHVGNASDIRNRCVPGPGFRDHPHAQRRRDGEDLSGPTARIQSPVCVKVVSIPEGEDAEQCRSRFYREAELLASASHPHILIDLRLRNDERLGVVLPLLPSTSKEETGRRITAGESAPIAFARSILHQVGDALTYLHGKGIVHRDLKPENILMPTESLAKVGDFGIAVLQDKVGVLTESAIGMGTVGYVAPEQQYGLKVDARADQYSLAALGYELLTGRRPLGLFPPPSRVNSS